MNTTQMLRTMAIVSGAVLIGALAGCADDQAPPEDPPLEDPAASAPAETEPADPVEEDPVETAPVETLPVETVPVQTEPATEAGEDPDAWVVDDAGIGPIELGADFASVLADVPGEWVNDEMCAGLAFWNAEDGSHLISFRTDGADGAGAIAEITVEGLTDGAVGPRTADDLGLASTQDDVLGVYPNAVSLDAQVGGGSFLRTSVDSSLFFSFQEGSDSASRVTVTSRELPSYEACA